MADSTLSNLTPLTLPSQATDLLLVGRGTSRPDKVTLSDMLNSSGLAATTTTYGVVLLAPNGGTTPGTVVQANDSRLTGGGGGSLSPWSTKTSAYTAANGDRLLADTSAGTFTITLPASPTIGDYVEINDPEETWPTINLTIARNGSNIDSLAENLVCNITAKIGLTYIDATIGWKVDFIAEIGGAGGSSQADSDSNIIANLVFS